jgi:hypothetical protein
LRAHFHERAEALLAICRRELRIFHHVNCLGSESSDESAGVTRGGGMRLRYAAEQNE